MRKGCFRMEVYDEWNEVKKSTQEKHRKLGIKPREIFWLKIGHNLGSEEYGKGKDFARPVIIVRRLTSDLFIGIPITTTIKNNDYFHSFTYNNKTRGDIDNSAMILQVRTYSIKRVLSKIGIVNKQDFNEILEKTKNLFNPI